MQAPLSKKMLLSIFRAQLRALDTGFLSASQSIPMASITPKGLTHIPAFSFSERDGQFEKITSYESLISRISNAQNTADLLNTMNQNIMLYKNEHIVLTLRVLARLVKGTYGNDIETLSNDERYIKLIEKAQENITEFNEYEILDFLFWLRRFRMSKIQTHVKEESIEKLTDRIKEFVKSKSFNFRNLVNLFYDLSFLNRSTDEISNELLNELKADPKLLTPFTIVQILQACSRKTSSLSARQYALADFVTKNIQNMLPEFDSDQKCHVFKYLAGMELHLNPPRFRTPNILYLLRNQLKESLDHLSEVGVINILESYEDLPQDFPIDLLEEIKEMVILTIQHNSANIKSFFLLDFLERMSNLRRNRRLGDDKIQIIFDEVAKRINTDEYMGRFRNIERLVEICERGDIKNDNLIQKIYIRVSDITNTFFSGPIFQFLVNNKVDVSELIDKFLTSDFFKSMGPVMMIRLLIVMSSLPNTKYDSQIKVIQANLLQKPEDLPRFLNVIASSGVQNNYVDEILQKIIEQLRIKKEGFNVSHFRNIFTSCINKTVRIDWIEYAKLNYTEFSTAQISKTIDAISNFYNLNHEQVLLMVSLLTQVFKPENIPLRKVTHLLKENKAFVLELAKNESKLKSFLINYVNWMDAHKSDVKIPIIHGLVRRLETCGVRLQIVNNIAKKAFEIFKASGANLNSQIELNYALSLLDKNILKFEDAKELYEKNKGHINDIFISSKLFTYVLRKAPEDYINNKEVIAEGQEKLEALNKYLSETNAKTVLNALAAIIAYPHKYLAPQKDLYIKSIKEFIGFGNQSLYSSLIHALPSDYIRNNYEFYVPFMREIINNYGNYNKRMNAIEIVKILKKFTEFGTRNPAIYNYILTDIGRMFNSFKPEEHAEIITSFSRLGIKQSDLFDKIIVKINHNPSVYTSSIRQIFFAFFKTGYDSPTAKQIMPELLGKLRLEKESHVIPYLFYIPILGLANEAQLLETLIGQQKEGEAHIPPKNTYILYEYLRHLYKDKPIVEVVKKWIKEFEKTTEMVNKESNARIKGKKLIGNYLKAMNVNFQEGGLINEFKIDLLIPDKKNIVKIFLANDINFDKFTLSGPAILKKKCIESLEGYKPIFINMSEFFGITEHMNKINYLIACGIENQNTTGVYDFSHIEKDNHGVVEETEEEVIKEEVVVPEVEGEEHAEEEKPKKSH